MLGTILNSICIILGSLIGASIARHIPKRFLTNLPKTCGIITIGVGVMLSSKAQHIPAVVLAILIGTIIGEILNLEIRLEQLITFLQKTLQRIRRNMPSKNADEFLQLYLTLVVLFSASSMGIFGAIQEGANGDINILAAKSILDFFTTIILALNSGFQLH